MHAVLLGASKGIGHLVLVSLLGDKSNKATLLLRNPACFDADPVVAPAIADGRVKVVKGDATVHEDVHKLFVEPVDVVVTSVGGTPKFTLSGAKLTDPTVCTRATLALVNTLAKLPAVPRVIVVSSMGIGAEHSVLPLPLRILYPWMLSGPHADKEGLEYLYAKASTLPNTAIVPATEILSEADREAAPQAIIRELIVVRPALLTDGEEHGVGVLKAQEGLRTYTCSRKDVAGFIVRECLPGQDEWVNKFPVLGY